MIFIFIFMTNRMLETDDYFDDVVIGIHRTNENASLSLSRKSYGLVSMKSKPKVWISPLAACMINFSQSKKVDKITKYLFVCFFARSCQVIMICQREIYRREVQET